MVKTKIMLGFLMLIITGAGYAFSTSLAAGKFSALLMICSAVCGLCGLALLISVELKINKLIRLRNGRILKRENKETGAE